MVNLSSDGSIIAQDFYSKAFISGEMSNVVKQNADLIGRMGEPWIFGLDMSDMPKESVESFLVSCGLEMIDYNQFGIKPV